MAEFHYDHIKAKYGDKAQLLFTDTDSLAYVIETEDIYKDMAKDPQLFDTSDYDKDHFLFSDGNKKVVGKFKDEMNGKIVYEFVGLRAKMYSFLYDKNGKNIEKKVCKGAKKCVIDKDLTHEKYLNTLIKEQQMFVKITDIRSFGHVNYTIEQNKVGLSHYDNKKFRLDPVFSKSYGHVLNETTQDPIITPEYLNDVIANRDFGTKQNMMELLTDFCLNHQLRA